ncbi:MAG: carboxypeptidase-like regulatory domain-containing protein [Candidatus Berkelbacteria bacterium]|nr:carboxypeptidase-like regulatory domain-containing protein [Candidatus Berkelbacteria bacterium]MCR4307008.1 carboxypeptidase-like regulatory domain-containing protein [Candidatus Berkelbacteria bacterium]
MNKSPVGAFIVIAVISLVVGYLLGNFLPFRGSTTTNQTSNPPGSTTTNTSIPSGKGILEVTVTDSSNQPMVGIEVDVGTKPGGQPEGWGAKDADTNGKASFQVAPGTYYVYFNQSRFPSGYVATTVEKAEVNEGQTTNVTIVLQKS